MDGWYSPDLGSCTTNWTVPATGGPEKHPSGSKLLGTRNFITIDDPLSSSLMVSSEGLQMRPRCHRWRAGLGRFTHLPNIKLISIDVVESALLLLLAFFRASTISPREILTKKTCPTLGPRIEQQSEILSAMKFHIHTEVPHCVTSLHCLNRLGKRRRCGKPRQLCAGNV